MSYQFEYIIIDRNPFIDLDRDLISIQIVPEFVYKASYPSWFFQEQKFVELFKDKYTVIKEFDSPFAAPRLVNNIQASWKGFILKKL
jgi:putative methyltransferase (TIGR04325 family)